MELRKYEKRNKTSPAKIPTYDWPDTRKEVTKKASKINMRVSFVICELLSVNSKN